MRSTSGRGAAATVCLISILALGGGSTAGAVDPVDQAVASMSLGEKIGQLLMVPVSGTRLAWADADVIGRYHVGGVILFERNYGGRAGLRAFTRQLQQVGRAGNRLGAGLLISVDQEGGTVKRFSDLPPFRSHPQLGQLGSGDVAFDTGAAAGAALRGVGVTMDLAPVGDVTSSARVMAHRSFGSHAGRVARLSAAFTRGLQSQRVAAAVKHFPGFGGASINSDDGPATITHPLSRLQRDDLAPFTAAVAAGAGAIMVSHGRYVNVAGSRPASLNPRLARTMLRHDLGYTGVAISDSLNAVAWYTGGSTPRACAATIDAGVDIALHTGGRATTVGCFRAIRDAVRAGTIGVAQVDAAVRRVLRLKAWARLWTPPAPPSPPPPQPSPEPSQSEGPTAAPTPEA